VDRPALPLSPVGFSADKERVFAGERRERVPKFMPRPLKDAIVVSYFLSLNYMMERKGCLYQYFLKFSGIG
jgi:hypothetical protein